jgi:hypothetical protein
MISSNVSNLADLSHVTTYRAVPQIRRFIVGFPQLRSVFGFVVDKMALGHVPSE